MALLVWKTGRACVSHQAKGLFIAHLSHQTKAFQSCKLLPHSILWNFPMWNCSHSKIRRLMCSTQVHGLLSQICVYSTRGLVCLNLGMKACISICPGTYFHAQSKVEPHKRRRDSPFISRIYPCHPILISPTFCKGN